MGVCGDHQVPVAQRRRHDGAVVLLLADAQGELLALGRLGHRHQHLVVLVGTPGP